MATQQTLPKVKAPKMEHKTEKPQLVKKLNLKSETVFPSLSETMKTKETKNVLSGWTNVIAQEPSLPNQVLDEDEGMVSLSLKTAVKDYNRNQAVRDAEERLPKPDENGWVNYSKSELQQIANSKGRCLYWFRSEEEMAEIQGEMLSEEESDEEMITDERDDENEKNPELGEVKRHK